MKLRIYTLGCKVNQYESEAICSSLKRNGIGKAKPDEKADIIIINSCTVTAQSDHKVRQTLRKAKKQDPEAVTVLTGCMVQAFPDAAEALPEADIILGTGGRDRILGHIMNFLSAKQRIVDIEEHKNGEKFEAMSVDDFSERTRAYMKIEDGCNRFCSYCIIPYARGRVRSKPLEDITGEAEELGQNGYSEIVLTGINLPAYGQELGLELCDAVEAAAKAEGVRRIRLGSLEPEKLTPDVIARLSKVDKLCPQFHLSLQSGCNETLKRMNRHYSTEEYSEIVENLRAAFPDAAITTDIMVGFAGETEEEFEESLKFAEYIGFAKVHVFAYSRRPGTKAYDFPNQLSRKTKEERSRRMIAVTEKSQLEFYRNQLGKSYPVLFEHERQKNLYEGYTPNYTPVFVTSPKDLQGQILPVRLEEVSGLSCIGKTE